MNYNNTKHSVSNIVKRMNKQLIRNSRIEWAEALIIASLITVTLLQWL